MKTLSEIIYFSQTRKLSDYISLNRLIDQALSNKSISVDKEINISILSSSTSNGVKETLRVLCGELNLLANIYIAGYNQIFQESFNPESGLYKSDPDLVIINIDTKAIAGKYFFLPYEISTEFRKDWVTETIDYLFSITEEISKRISAKIILHNLEVPIYSPLGILETKQDYGFIESIEDVNRGLREKFRKNNQIFLFDYDAFCSRIGKDNIFDPKLYYFGDVKLNPHLLSDLCSEYLRYIQALKSAPKKCIVLDLDNTLWGGVIGESGMDGINLGPTPEGRPFMEFQQCLLSLYNRGVILAINSKNNQEDAMGVIKNHPFMILKEKHFAAMRINWDDKSNNLRSIAEELNIGLDSLVFIDDDHLNRGLVSEFLPEVFVLDMPEDPSLYVKKLMELTLFESFTITDEDQNKGKMYQEEKQRKAIKTVTKDFSEYLKLLGITIRIEEAKKEALDRIAQLSQKTNQFNLTTRRYTVEDIMRFSQNIKYLVISIYLSDKFGDSGLTGIAIINKNNEQYWRIDTFLLSCRILGRKAEETLLAYIINQAKKEKVSFLRGEFIPTNKNEPAKDFLRNNGFKKLKNIKEIEIWEYNLINDYPYPDFINVITNDSGETI